MSRELGATVLVVLTVALGVGVATALFAYLATFLGFQLATPHADRVAMVRNRGPQGPIWSLSSVEHEALRALPGVETVAATAVVNATVSTDAGNLFAWGRFVSGSYFDLFGGRAAVGRLLGPGDDDPGAPAVVVLSHRLWRNGFAADPALVGRTLRVNGESCTVVGVAARGLAGLGFASELFLPLRLGDRVSGVPRSADPQSRWLSVYLRVAPAAGDWDRARAGLEAAFAALDRDRPLPEGETRQPFLLPAGAFDPELTQDPFYLAARLLAGAGLLFVVLGAVNLAGLLLARAAAREREWAVRKALGASPVRLASAILGRLAGPAALGWLLALLVAIAIGRWMSVVLHTPMAGIGPSWASEDGQSFPLDARDLLFAAAATALVVVVAALPPLVRVLRRDPCLALRAGSPGGGADRTVLGPRRGLVVGQLALAIVLLVGSGLLWRSLRAAAASPLGLDPRGLGFATLHLPRSDRAESDRAALLRLVERARELDGVTGASLALLTPVSPASRLIDVARAETPAEAHSRGYNLVGPGYFETLGVALVAGRALDERDTPEAPPAVVVTAALARELWGAEPAVGRRLRLTGPVRPDEAGPEFEVVGVAADAAFVEPTRPRPAMLFFAYGQRRHSRMTLMVRSRVPLARVEPALRELLATVRADASVIDLVAADAQLRRTLYPLRLYATVAGGLAIAGLATSLLGLFALQLYAVNLQRRDFAVRLALGARRRDLVRLVLGEAARLFAVGLAVGLTAAAALGRLLGALLFGVAPLDPSTFAGVALGLGIATLAASWLPAHRAASVEPNEHLRAL